jgi:mono/diheme cytochrome c family protein
VQFMRKYLSSASQALFGDPVRAFGVVSVGLLLALAITPAKEHFSQWHGYQRRYLRLIRDRGDAMSLRRRFQPGIHQIWLPELGVVDRCTTCHLGLNEASLADVNRQPFRKHPAIPHSLDGFGCVICHGGQGAATTVAEAHHSERAGEEPILPARYIESGCGQCHQNALPGTPQLNLGRRILTRYGCIHCHAITLPDGAKVVATDHPPSLAHIADKTTREWIYTWLKDPLAYAASTTMPNYKLGDADASDISAYLMSSSTPQAGDTVTAGTKSAAQTDPAAGPSLYGESFCSSCHAVQNAAGNLVGGDVGPELTRIGNKVKPEWLRAMPVDRVPAVNQQKVRAQRQLLHRAAHGFERRLANIDAVDGFRIHRGNGPGDGVRANLHVELDALFLAEFLRVGESVELEAGSQNHRRGNHRAKQRTAAHLVHSGNAPRSALARVLFQRPTANRGSHHIASIWREAGNRAKHGRFPHISESNRNVGKLPGFDGKKAQKRTKNGQKSRFMFTDMPTCLNRMLFILLYLLENCSRKSGLHRVGGVGVKQFLAGFLNSLPAWKRLGIQIFCAPGG